MHVADYFGLFDAIAGTATATGALREFVAVVDGVLDWGPSESSREERGAARRCAAASAAGRGH
ncbi:MAG: hypothetical protein QOI03_1721, partial [Solirubrobacteraceae bacterium]|nr:hypothetical protein [Solirubrobacteraceae bacterium]